MSTAEQKLEAIRQVMLQIQEKRAVSEYTQKGHDFGPPTIDIPTFLWDKLVTLSEN